MSSAGSTPGSAPKAMSSRLLTMKFMQRAAASSPASPSSPAADEPPSKRLKKNSDSPSRPAVDINTLADQKAIQAALDAEEAKRQAALERQAAEAGDTRWVLSFEGQNSLQVAPKPALRVVQAGYASLDVPLPSHLKSTEVEDSDESSAMIGRRSFGKFNQTQEKQGSSSDDSSGSDSEDEESDESSDDDNDPTSELIKASRQEAAQRVKAERKAKRKAEKDQAREFVKRRKKKEVKLNRMTSLTGRQDRQAESNKACFKCGGPHLKADCPQNQNHKRFFQGGDDGPLRKARKVN